MTRCARGNWASLDANLGHLKTGLVSVWETCKFKRRFWGELDFFWGVKEVNAL